jgi:hypothetical protein
MWKMTREPATIVADPPNPMAIDRGFEAAA